ncbi:MAG: putative ABC transporter permease [Bacilli bacterium]
MEKILFYFLLFLIYSSLGWLIEVIAVGFKEKKFINRGFLIGPYCPIYGIASIIMIFYLDHYKDNILTVFLLAVVVCTFVEYIVSYIMEKLFNARWWDYSKKKFNINGRVCLTNAFAFGVLGVLLVYVVNPLLTSLLLNVNSTLLSVISLILLVLFITDFMISMKISYKLKNTVNNLRKDSTEDFNKKVREVIESKVLNRRIIKAFPKLKINFIKDKISDMRTNFEAKIENAKDKKKN